MDKHDTLLIACSTAEKRKLLRGVLRDNYNLLEANNSNQMQLLLQQNRNVIAAVLFDLDVWENTNVKVLETVPAIVFTRDNSPELLHKGFDRGASDVIPVDYDADSMLRRIETIVQLHLHRQHLQVLVEEQAEVLRHSNELLVDALSSIIEYRSSESGQHILRIRHFTKILLEEVRRSCPEYQLTDETISIIASASALHDVGKITIPDAILMKPGKLTVEEWEIMKKHSAMGCQILNSLAEIVNEEYLRYAHNICHYHHERWDGSGYPEGLEGNDIPICAQVVGLADAFDALTSKRVYKDAYSLETAVSMILNGECGAFSPALLECFKHVVNQYKDLAQSYADGLAPKTEKFDATLPAPASQDVADSMDRLQGKYMCLLHYINCFVLEVSVDMGHYHLRYNPYPELASIGAARNLPQLKKILLDQIVHPEDRQRMKDLLETGIEQFLQGGLRRQSFRFLFCGHNGQPEHYDVTLLRINVNQTKNRGFGVLCRKVSSADIGVLQGRVDELAQLWAENTIVCRNDGNLTLVQVENATGTLAGYTVDEIRMEHQGKLINLVHPQDRENLLQTMREKFQTGTAADVQYRVVTREGNVRWVLSRNHLVVGTDGREYICTLMLDNSESHDTNEAVQQKIHRYEIILAQTENVLFEWDMTSDVIIFSDTWESIFGFEPIRDHVREQLNTGTFIHPDDVELMKQAISQMVNGSPYEMVEVRIATARGRYIWCRFRATAIRDHQQGLQKIYGIIINIDAEKQSNQALRERAERDALTKLLNKSAGRKQAEEYINNRGDTVNCALMMIDLDNFKQINDHYGHLFGDTVLTQVSRVLKKMFRSQDIIARVGGDEFMVLMRGISDQELLKNRCRQLINVFGNTFRSLSQEIPLSCSVGVAIAPKDGQSYYELFQRADQAMYQAKARGKNTFAFYDSKSTGIYDQHRHMSVIDSDQEPGLAEDSLIQYAFRRLYTSENVEESINEILDLIGRKMNVSRVYIFENSNDDRYCSNTYEWCNEGIQPEIQNLQNISYADDLAGYMDIYDENGIFYCPDVDTLPENIFNIVAPQGIKSLLHCAIRDKGQFRGYIGFDECVTRRMWTKEQINALTFLAEAISVFLLKKRQQEQALQQAEEIGSVLDSQNAWISIVDPETWELRYLNARLRNAVPHVKPGMRCYEAMMGRQTPCEGCPCQDILEKREASALIYNENNGVITETDAALVKWGGKLSCMVTHRKRSKDTK